MHVKDKQLLKVVQNTDDDDYNGKGGSHDDEVKVDCEKQKLLWYVVGSPKVLTCLYQCAQH